MLFFHFYIIFNFFIKAIECFKKASHELGDPRGFLNIGHIFSEVLFFKRI